MVKKSKKAKTKSKKGNGKVPTKKKKAVVKAKVKSELDKFGFRKKSLKSAAAAMYATKKGATLGEIKEKLNSAQLNLLKELEEKGHKITRTKEPGKGKKPVTRYRIVS